MESQSNMGPQNPDSWPFKSPYISTYGIVYYTVLYLEYGKCNKLIKIDCFLFFYQDNFTYIYKQWFPMAKFTF